MMFKNCYSLLLLLLLVLASDLPAQTARMDMRRARQAYQREVYQQAEISYRSAIARDSTLAAAHLAVGESLYRQKDVERAVEAWRHIAQSPTAHPLDQAEAWHNIGNTQMDAKQYDKAIEAYKESLRRNPTDEETRYNLALAMRLNKKPPTNGGGGGGQSDTPREPQNDSDPNDTPSPSSSHLDREQSERILDALRQKEQQMRRQLSKQQPQQVSPQGKKNW